MNILEARNERGRDKGLNMGRKKKEREKEAVTK